MAKDIYVAPVLLTGGMGGGTIETEPVRPSMQGGEHPQWDEEEEP